MGLFDIFNASKIKKENEALKTELAEKNKLLTPEMLEAEQLKKNIDVLNGINQNLNKSIEILKSKEAQISAEIQKRSAELIDVEDRIMFQDFALYTPKYELANSEKYKEALDSIRNSQKEFIKKDIAILGNDNWEVNGSKSQGKKLVGDMKKLFLRAFNSECDSIVEKVTVTNYETSLKKITSSCDAISKLGKMMQISISQPYLSAKIKELDLALEYREMKQREKEEQKELKAQMREEAKLQKEIEEARKKVEKEQKHYLNALEVVNQQLAKASEEEKAAILAKKAEIENGLVEIDKNLKDIDYRQANAKAGYVYIISNIGAFGENVYKIGMTRRLDPTERIDELGDASVPFDFDIHAMIFSDNAPALEAALHKAFENKKINMINQRREFFRVSLDEIKAVVRKNYDKSVDFIETPAAEQYRQSVKMQEV